MLFRSFGGVGLFVALALTIGCRRAWASLRASGAATVAVGGRSWSALRDVLTLGHLHAQGQDCVHDVESRTPWRRYFHHCTFYGFALCFASTTVAAIYHVVFGWRAPYAYASVPVVLGTIGGVGLVVGPIGLLVERSRRDKALGDPAQNGLDVSFVVALLLTSVTGLALQIGRAHV